MNKRLFSLTLAFVVAFSVATLGCVCALADTGDSAFQFQKTEHSCHQDASSKKQCCGGCETGHQLDALHDLGILSSSATLPPDAFKSVSILGPFAAGFEIEQPLSRKFLVASSQSGSAFVFSQPLYISLKKLLF